MSRSHRSLLILLALTFALCLEAQAQTTDAEFWPTGNFNYDITTGLRLQLNGERVDEGGERRIQTKYGAYLNYRMRRIVSRLTHIDSEDHYYITMSLGYEYVSPTGEDRLVVQGTPRYEPGLGILLTDRSRFEFRWLEPGYDFRYRNKLTAKRNIRLGKVNLSPYAAGEVYWDRKYHAFNENSYSFGIEHPFKNWFMLDTFYQRQNCNTCSKEKINVLGLSVNFFFGRKQ
ncbi:MAG: DUF2490 domain-containing protein [Pyrinomonadaceae bacterium]|nr:DUF2490 domain-containing protein [Pyrinomonadaceae bacterium]